MMHRGAVFVVAAVYDRRPALTERRYSPAGNGASHLGLLYTPHSALHSS